MRRNFFKGKRVLITGHSGFVGSWLTLWLNDAGADVTGLSLYPPSNPYMYKFLDLEDEVNNIRGDIRNLTLVKRVMRENRPQIVLHLAAQPILLRSYEDPVLTYTTNLIGTMNVLEACRSVGSVGAIVNITSDKVYKNLQTKRPYAEDDVLGGFDPYSSSKAGAELITSAYRNSFLSGIGVATTRAGNILGGGDWGRYRLVTDLVTAQSAKRKLVLRNPRGVRPWTYVLDIANGYLMLTERLHKKPKSYSEAWNFSTDYTKTVSDLVKEFSRHYRISYEVKGDKRHEESLLLLDSTKSRKRLGWKPAMSFNATVKATASWYKRFYTDRSGISDYTRTQLRQFESGLNE